jgi:hypothetical protein
MIRHLPGSRGTAALAAIAVLLTACGDPTSSESAAGGATTAPPKNGLFDRGELALPGGVRVLSQEQPHEYLRMPRGRYAVRLTPSLVYEVDVPEGSVAYAGAFLNLPGAAGPRIVVEPVPSNIGLPAHPCHDHGQRLVGPTVRDLAMALRRQPFLEVTRPTPISVGGHSGLFLTVAVPQDADFTRCEDDRVDLYTRDRAYPLDTWTVDEPHVLQLWVIDVDGARYVVRGDFPSTASKSHRAVVAQMVESITFTGGE